MIERITPRARAKRLATEERSGHSFQRWLGEWSGLRAAGWSVTVLIADDDSHCVALACRASGPQQLSLLAERTPA